MFAISNDLGLVLGISDIFAAAVGRIKGRQSIRDTWRLGEGLSKDGSRNYERLMSNPGLLGQVDHYADHDRTCLFVQQENSLLIVL